MDSKQVLRKQLRERRRAHVEAQPDTIRALLFMRPPAPLMERIAPGSVIGLYRATRFEAPASGYARFLAEAGHRLALPWFAGRESAMIFREHTDPHAETDLEPGPFGLLQPSRDAAEIVPEFVFVPLLGFTDDGQRIGQGAGHYDRWLAAHPGVGTVGMAWDAQLCESLPTEDHDMPLDAIVTPTRLYGPF